jgi:hypothetical protein
MVHPLVQMVHIIVHNLAPVKRENLPLLEQGRATRLICGLE